MNSRCVCEIVYTHAENRTRAGSLEGCSATATPRVSSRERTPVLTRSQNFVNIGIFLPDLTKHFETGSKGRCFFFWKIIGGKGSKNTRGAFLCLERSCGYTQSTRHCSEHSEFQNVCSAASRDRTDDLWIMRPTRLPTAP